MNVGILGGTGKFGRALAARLAETGDVVVIGSRDEARAQAAAAAIGVRGARNDALGDVDLVVLAVEANAALATVRDLRLTAPLLSVAAEVEFDAGIARPPGNATSIAERVVELVDVPVAAGLHTIAALKLARGKPDEDALVCGDDDEAKRLAVELAARVVNGRVVDAGPLEAARALEAMTAVLLNVNRGYKTHAGVRITGIE